MREYGIILLLVTTALIGCANSPAHVSDDDSEVLTGTWRVEDIDGRGVIDRSQVTIDFDTQGKVSGSTGCNRYTGEVNLSDAAFRVERVVTTRRACIPAIAKQEQRFLAALNEAQRFSFDAGIWIVVYDEAGQRRLKLIRTAPVNGSPGIRQDKAVHTHTLFQCEGAGEVSMRFVGPETIALSTDNTTSMLPRIKTASGAQYGDKRLRFWNKGDEAVLTLDGQRFACLRTSKTQGQMTRQ